ncbi:hypothetical protein Cs7R123_01370 [Catellatospora sp. TT07R-123]|uniref:DUF4230 domain-containing protein n=1 Tax=Catellatospora sp. TT07R-123 TaxID=2733863 RepID=UPI001B06CE0D|nr:DUF4230 domain-containing protein [Catellatospora sp. TT07R-123]GHJ42795.1 hypothetical protein Cs7R123_01370 [Catellatospora sp. TT07R-123]
MSEHSSNHTLTGIPAPRRRFRFRLLSGIVSLAVLVAAGLVAFLYFQPGEPDTDRSAPVVLRSITDLSRYEAAKGNFEVVVDLETSTGGFWGWLKGRRVLFVAVGSVDAYVDFQAISAGAIDVSSDRRSVTITLPEPQLEEPALDHEKSHVAEEDRDLLPYLRDIFSRDNETVDRAYKEGSRKIAEAAEQAGLKKVAEDNTRRMLTDMMTALGFTNVKINFESSGD